MNSFVLTLTLALPLAAQSPMFRGDPAHTGVYAPPREPISGKIAWSFQAMDWTLYSSLENVDGGLAWPTTPAAVNGRLYFCDGPMFYALDAAGTQIYRKRLGGWTLGSPAVVDGVAYVAASDGNLYALDADDGHTVWTARIGHRTWLKQYDNWDVIHSSPTVANGTIYVGSADGRMHAVSTSGIVKWTFETSNVIRASAAVADGKVYFGSFDGNVYGVDARTGQELWKTDTRIPGVPWSQIQGSCAIMDGVVYVGGRSSFFFGLDARSGRILWKQDHNGSWVTSSPAVRNGVAYIGDSDQNSVNAVDSRGHLLWSFQAPGAVFASPALAGEVLYVATNDNYNMNGTGSLSAVDVRTGKGLWTVNLPASVWSSPVVADGAVYVGCADGNLYAIR